MSNLLNISLFQTNPVWQDAEANIKILDEWFEKIPAETHIVILPEMFLTGFSMDVDKISQEMNGMAIQWLISKAKFKRISIMGSLTIKENDHFYNRLLIASSDGSMQWYDKRHLFRMGEEQEHFSPGRTNIISQLKGWNIMPLVCYDLRFPVWSRNHGLKYDLLVYVANWPQARHEAFLTLLKARSIENQCYVAAVNRVGIDGKGIKYSGDSVLIDPKGNFLGDSFQSEGIVNGTLSLKELNEYRQKFPAYLDADEYEIK